MDGMIFKIKKYGIMQKRTAYACIEINMDGQKEVLSLHIEATENSKYWISMKNELKTCTVQTILTFLKG